MKKQLLFLFFFLAFYEVSKSQNTAWPGPSDNSNVGIGTTSPSAKLEIISPSSFSSIFSTNNYNTGIGVGNKLSMQSNGTSITNLQWIYSNNGFITTLSSYEHLAFGTGTSYTERMRISNNGNVGIGTSAPTAKLEVNSGSSAPGWLNVYSSTTSSAAQSPEAVISLGTNQGGNDIPAAQINGINELNNDSGSGSLSFATRNAAIVSEKMRITSAGNVLIGKTSQLNTAYKLDVAGPVRADRVVVNTSGADFVFSLNYNLPPLSRVNNFINANHHLPDVPSAAQMQSEGMDVGELNKRLLQKVEELTLYLLDEHRKNKAQQQEINVLKKQVNNLSIKHAK